MPCVTFLSATDLSAVPSRSQLQLPHPVTAHTAPIARAGVTLRFGPLRGSLPRRERLALHCLKLSGFEAYVPRARRPKPVVESRSEEKVEAGLVEAGEQRKADHLAASTGANRCSQNKQGSHDRCRLLDTRG